MKISATLSRKHIDGNSIYKDLKNNFLNKLANPLSLELLKL